MKSKLLNAAWLLISLSCICGMCSKGDDQSGNTNNNYTEPVLKANDTWIYMTSFFVYANNYVNDIVRPYSRKWIATGINTDLPFHAAYSYPNAVAGSDTNKNSLSLDFENTDMLTRFCANSLNPNGKEKVSIFLKKFNRAPIPGTYIMDIDFKEGFCWYDVYKANGEKYDSTRHQSFTNSTFTVNSMTFIKAIDSRTNQYKMSGSANIEVIYFPTGSSSSSDVHVLQCLFNNVPIDFYK